MLIRKVAFKFEGVCERLHGKTHLIESISHFVIIFLLFGLIGIAERNDSNVADLVNSLDHYVLVFLFRAVERPCLDVIVVKLISLQVIAILRKLDSAYILLLDLFQ